MKKILLIILTSLIVLVINANNNTSSGVEVDTVELSGTIIDNQSGELLAGVAVKVKELNKTVYTDFNGSFSLEIEPGKYTIESELVSYKKTNRSIDIKINADKLKIKMEMVN